MKKGCLIILGVFAMLLVGAVVSAFVGFRMADGRFGIVLAPHISHDTVANNDTRIRLLIKPELLTPFLAEFVPADAKAQIPTASFELQEVLFHVVPRELALLAQADVLARKLRLTLFVNEKRGGPVFAEELNKSDIFEQVRQVVWTSQGLELRDRGVLVATGEIAIPEAVEEELFDIWPTRTQRAPETIDGTNQLELVIDNRNGDILALAAAMATIDGQSWESVRREQAAEMAMGVIQSIHAVRLAANMLDKDSASFDLRIDSDEKSGPGLHFLVSGLALPWLRDFLKQEQGLTLVGEPQWDPEQQAVIGTFTVTGLEALIKSHIPG